MEVLSALQHDAHRIVAVELDENVAKMVGDTLREHSGELYGDPAVEVRLAEARRFLETGSEHFDVISISLLDSFASSASGVQKSARSLVTAARSHRWVPGSAPARRASRCPSRGCRPPCSRGTSTTEGRAGRAPCPPSPRGRASSPPTSMTLSLLLKILPNTWH